MDLAETRPLRGYYSPVSKQGSFGTTLARQSRLCIEIREVSVMEESKTIPISIYIYTHIYSNTNIHTHIYIYIYKLYIYIHYTSVRRRRCFHVDLVALVSSC